MTAPPFDGALFRATAPAGAAVLVLHAADGQRRDGWAQQFADEGFDALAIRWFGDDGIVEVPIETVSSAATWLAHELGVPVAVAGHSKGAELALAAAAYETGPVQAVLAWAPSAVAWYGFQPNDGDASTSPRSSWSWRGEPLPCVFTQAVPRESDRGVVMLPCYECPPDSAADGTVIPLERFPGRVLLVSGTDDRFWPSEEMARRIVRRMERHGRGGAAVHVSGTGAGHLITPDTVGLQFPGVDMGGSPEADRELSARAWQAAIEVLRDLGSPTTPGRERGADGGEDG